MQVIRPGTSAVGRDAAVRKYDALSALMAFALAGDPNRQRLVLRLMALITTRYNWQRNELAMGQREIARLWCVDERTVKRDMARLRALGWVQLRRQGTRGRVAQLALDWARIMADTRPVWDNIGPDFVARAGGGEAPEPAAPADSTVVPFRRPDATPEGGVWGAAAARLRAEDAALCSAGFAGLAEAGLREGCLHLVAPTRFQASYIHTHFAHRLLMAVQAADPSIRGVAVEGA